MFPYGHDTRRDCRAVACRAEDRRYRLDTFYLIFPRGVVPRRSDEAPDLLAQAVGGLVRDAKLPLKFLAGYAVARREEQIDGIEPRLQRRPRILKHGPGGRVEVVATMRASKRAASRHAVEGAFQATCPTHVFHAVPRRHDVGQASFLVRKAGEEVADRKGWRFAVPQLLAVAGRPARPGTKPFSPVF